MTVERRHAFHYRAVRDAQRALRNDPTYRPRLPILGAKCRKCLREEAANPTTGFEDCNGDPAALLYPAQVTHPDGSTEMIWLSHPLPPTRN